MEGTEIESLSCKKGCILKPLFPAKQIISFACNKRGGLGRSELKNSLSHGSSIKNYVNTWISNSPNAFV